MLTAKNYFAQFEHSFISHLNKKPFYEGVYKDIDNLRKLKTYFKNMVHFTMPHGGRLFDDGLKGIQQKIIRLPYPAISIEYKMDADDQHTGKKLFFAIEKNKNELIDELKEYGPIYGEETVSSLTCEKVILIISCIYVETRWMVIPLGFILPTEWDKDIRYSHDIDNKEQCSEKESNGDGFKHIPGGYFSICPAYFESFQKEVGREFAFKNMSALSGVDVDTLLEFIEALSCSNVKMENIQNEDKKLNKKRIAEKKLPFYETKVLTLDVPGETKVVSESLGGSGITQRQHLRRGHIRRLANGNNIWINSYIAGSAAKGVITKGYNLVKS